MEGFALLLSLASIVITIVILVRWWIMTDNIKAIREHLTTTGEAPKLTYLVAIGEIEKAEKSALVMLVDKMMPIYNNEYDFDKAAHMNDILRTLLPKMARLGLRLPEYVTSGEKFIDYMNALTDSHVPYADPTQGRS